MFLNIYIFLYGVFMFFMLGGALFLSLHTKRDNSGLNSGDKTLLALVALYFPIMMSAFF